MVAQPEPEDTRRELGRFVGRTTYDDVPPAFVDVAVRAFVDTTGVALAGTVERGTRTVVETLGDLAGSDGSAPVLGLGASLPLPEAVCANCTAAHQLDYDDTSLRTHNHPSATVVPTILTMGHRRSISGPAAITAYAVGVETQYAIAGRMDTGTHVGRGWHATSTLGTFGAAATAAWLLDLDRRAAEHTLAVASSFPAGLQANFGTPTKPLHAGHAARSGVTAALLASNGFTGSGSFEGSGGFFDVYAGGRSGDDPPAPGEDWGLLADGTYHLKKYPCCSSSHPAIAAVSRLRAEHDLRADAVESIRVVAPAWTRDELVYPDPSTPLESKFSMEHALAHAILHGDPDERAFRPAAVEDPEVAAMRAVVEYEVDPDVSYGSYATTVEIDTTDGRTIDATVTDPPGSHANPLSDAELREKFRRTATRVLPDPTAADLYDALRSLAELDDLGPVLDAVAR